MKQLPLPPKKKPSLLSNLRRNAKVFYSLLVLVALIVAGATFLATHNAMPDSKQSHSAETIKNTDKSTNPLGQNNAKSKPKPIKKAFKFPGGNTKLGDNYRFIALYGAPGSSALGALGEQSIDKSVQRVKDFAKQYKSLSKQIIYPAFEIIATVAAAGPTSNNDYSREADATKLLPWIIEAEKQKIYVILDLQPGHSSFLKQAKQYASLLKYPNVGLALDPEWRLSPGQIHMEQIGKVSAKEVNQTSEWLAKLVKKNKLPQKVFLLHQFRLDMLTDRTKIDTTSPELSFMIQMDGQGSQAEKQATWQAMLQNPPINTKFGWKNFYRQDKPMLTPTETMSIAPQPWYISYQ